MQGILARGRQAIQQRTIILFVCVYSNSLAAGAVTFLHTMNNRIDRLYSLEGGYKQTGLRNLVRRLSLEFFHCLSKFRRCCPTYGLKFPLTWKYFSDFIFKRFCIVLRYFVSRAPRKCRLLSGVSGTPAWPACSPLRAGWKYAAICLWSDGFTRHQWSGLGLFLFSSLMTAPHPHPQITLLHCLLTFNPLSLSSTLEFGTSGPGVVVWLLQTLAVVLRIGYTPLFSVS